MKLEIFEKLGRPAITIGDLKIWVHGRAYPDSNDPWDGNWLNVTALCSTHTAKVWSAGVFIHLSELLQWQKEVFQLHQSLKGTASLECAEPNLHVTMEIDKLGRIETHVQLTEDHLTERHEFLFSLDQTFLTELIQSIGSVFKEYPMREAKL